MYVGLFEESGNMAAPWAQAGHTCIILDLQNDNAWHGKTFHAQCDLSTAGSALAIIRALAGGIREPALVAAFPPCDHLAVSGARWFAGKGLGLLRDSINLFAVAAEICEALDAPFMIENPVSTISSYWREPDYTFHPHHFAGFCSEDTYVKKTCLWTGNGFRMPDPRPFDGVELDDRIHRAPPGEGRKKFRSATPLGFARAVYKANAGTILEAMERG